MRSAFEIKVDDTFDSVEANRYHGPCIALKVRRDRIKKFLELHKSPRLDVGGVYLLLSNNASGKKVYVGESEPVYKRIKQHLANPVFDWDEAIIFIDSMSDASWEKSNIKYLEHNLYQELTAAASYEVQNKNTPTQSKVTYPWAWDSIVNEIKSLTHFLGHPNLFKKVPTEKAVEPSSAVLNVPSEKEMDPKANPRVGQVVQSIFPWLFANGYITEKELKYLLSAKAKTDFKIGGKDFRVLLDSRKKDHGVISGLFRYYSHILLPFNGKTYYLSNQFREKGRAALISWLETLGVSASTLENILSAK